jgi:nitrogen fixation protein NifU and related proteins
LRDIILESTPGIQEFRQHSDNFLNMAFQQDRLERLQHPDGYGRDSRECGDTLEIFLMASEGGIRRASFYSEGCIYTMACANTLVHMIEGKSVPEAMAVSPRHIVEFLQTLPETEIHCAELAVRALQIALLDLEQTALRPWAKYYRKL